MRRTHQLLRLIGTLIAASAAASSCALEAQVTSRAADAGICGVVFDSVAGKPLAGASVQVAVTNSLAAPWTATTDSLGRYVVTGLPSGRVVIGFYHDALTALGLDAPTRSVELSEGAEALVDLAIPSSETIRGLRCGESPAQVSGMLTGYVRDVVGRGAIDGTKVIMSWRAFALDAANYRVVTERVTGSVEPDGALLVCHLPVDAPLDLHVSAPGHRAVDGSVVTVPATGIGRLDVLLTDSSLVAGRAMIRGTVRRESGQAVTSGQVFIKGLDRAVPIRDGAFVASALPEGTWVAESRVIGVEPRDVLFTAVDSALAAVAITVGNASQRLEAVTVVGKMDRNLRVLDEVLRRKRVGMGTTFLPGHPALKTALWVEDVMKEARGFRVGGRNSVSARLGCRQVAVYLNGDPVPGGFEDLDNLVTMPEVLAIETWPDISSAPVIFRYGFGFPDPYRPHVRSAPCAVVAVWTIRRF